MSTTINYFNTQKMKELFAKRLKNARIMAGLSMDALAEIVGVSKEAIRKYEHSEAQPGSTNLIKISKALSVNIDYFFRSSIVELGVVEFRKKSSLGKIKTNQIKQRIIDSLERYIELEKIFNIQYILENPVEHMQIQCGEDAELAADIVRKEWSLGLNPIKSIIETFEDNHIKVIEVKEEDVFDGLSTLVDDIIPVIVVNQNYTIERKRFTLLHELGHLLLNISEGTPKKEQEKFCDRFAASFLIPKLSFIKEIGERRSNISVNELAELQIEWGISIRALIIRARDLNVINKSKVTGFFIKCNRNPEFKIYVDKPRFAESEASNRFNQLIARGLAQELISISKASALSNIPVNQIKSEIAFI